MTHTIAVLLDDADHAQQQLGPQFPGDDGTRWLFVACAPRLTHRIGKWASHSSREHWRRHWSERLFERLGSWTGALPAARLQTMVARDALPKVIEQLQAQHGPHVQVIDARRPKTVEGVQPMAGMRGLLSMLLGVGVGLALMVGD